MSVERNPNAPRTRASDAHRDEMLQVLATALSDGRLDAAEFDERQTAALQVRYLDEFAPLVDDLPDGRAMLARIGATQPSAHLAVRPGNAVAPTGQPEWSLAMMSGRDIVVDPGTPKVVGIAIMGGDNIDLTQVMAAGVQVTIETFAMMGGNSIYVPEGVRVVDKTIGIMGGHSIPKKVQGDGSNGTVILTGLAIMGGNTIKRAKDR